MADRRRRSLNTKRFASLCVVLVSVFALYAVIALCTSENGVQGGDMPDKTQAPMQGTVIMLATPKNTADLNSAYEPGATVVPQSTHEAVTE